MIRVVAIDMGYGHLRAGQPLADLLGVPLQELDRGALATSADERTWSRARAFHEGLSRLSQRALIGRPFLSLMDGYTRIAPLGREGSLARGTLATAAFARLARRGLGSGLAERLRAGDRLLTTFYAPALIADQAGLQSWCVVTDADCHRVWVADAPARTRIRYCAPSTRVVERLQAYGVPRARITLTGFPLPLELLGGPALPALRANLAARLARLHGRAGVPADRTGQLPSPPAGAGQEAPLVVFAVGGAGAQAPLAHRLLRSLAPALEAGRLRLALVAGVRRAVAEGFLKEAAELQVRQNLEILHEPDWPAYYRRFNALLARADVLWTKPSEMTFYAALGLPLVIAPHVGDHERYNAEWVREHGAGLSQGDPENAHRWLLEWLSDGTLTDAAWAGFTRLPARGTYAIADEVTNSHD